MTSSRIFWICSCLFVLLLSLIHFFESFCWFYWFFFAIDFLSCMKARICSSFPFVFCASDATVPTDATAWPFVMECPSAAAVDAADAAGAARAAASSASAFCTFASAFVPVASFVVDSLPFLVPPLWLPAQGLCTSVAAHCRICLLHVRSLAPWSGDACILPSEFRTKP